MKKKLGRDLRVGDTIEVWWTPRADTITGLRPYKGPLEYLFKEGARIAEFELNKTGMTIENDGHFTVLSGFVSPASLTRDRVQDILDTGDETRLGDTGYKSTQEVPHT